MKTLRRTKIRIEKHELKFVRMSVSTKLFCRVCRSETQHLPIIQTALALDFTEREVFRLAESGRIHSTETTHGQLLICADSTANVEK